MKKKQTLPDVSDYPAFIKGSSKLLCSKMIECYSGLYFSLSPEVRNEITVDRCVTAALRDVDNKLKLQNDLMKRYSVLCYQAILDSPCKEVGNAFFWNPACFALRQESEKAYMKGGYKPPIVEESEIENSTTLPGVKK